MMTPPACHRQPTMHPTRRLLLSCALLGPMALRAQGLAANPMQPLAHWVGGEWVGEFDGPGGQRYKIVRDYRWSFDQRLIVGRSWGEAGGRRRQTRETVFFWNADSGRIEFIDHLDQGGGHGLGHIELRDGRIHMQVRIVGNRQHPDWRATIVENGDEQEIRVEGLRDGQWADMGGYRYRRVR